MTGKGESVLTARSAVARQPLDMFSITTTSTPSLQTLSARGPFCNQPFDLRTKLNNSRVYVCVCVCLRVCDTRCHGTRKPSPWLCAKGTRSLNFKLTQFEPASYRLNSATASVRGQCQPVCLPLLVISDCCCQDRPVASAKRYFAGSVFASRPRLCYNGWREKLSFELSPNESL